MAYTVITSRNNGYRCGCCHDSWDSTKIVSDKEEALAMCPTSHDSDGDSELESVEVVDGTTGDTIAEARLEYCGGRGRRYQVQRWFGVKEGVPFEEIKGGEASESWTDLKARILREAAEKELKKAEADLQAAQARVDALRRAPR